MAKSHVSPKGLPTKHKGSLAELIACAWLLKQGYEVFRNVSAHGIADMIAWRIGASPVMIDVQMLSYWVSRDGKKCSVASRRLAASSQQAGVRVLYACLQTGNCAFDAEPLVASLGYARGKRPEPTLGCSVDGCKRKHAAKGLCKNHYVSWKYGRSDRSLSPGMTPHPRQCL